MFIDLTLGLSPEHYSSIDQTGSREGHIGTHFDIMDKAFPLESFRTAGRVIDVSHIEGREVEVADLDGYDIGEGDMVIFYTGQVEAYGYGTPAYYQHSVNLSDAVIHHLVERKVRLIGADAAGVQKPKKHEAVDRFCAERNIFIVENLDNLKALMAAAKDGFTVYTAPTKRTGLSGLPCRVLAEVAG